MFKIQNLKSTKKSLTLEGELSLCKILKHISIATFLVLSAYENVSNFIFDFSNGHPSHQLYGVFFYALRWKPANGEDYKNQFKVVKT